MGFNSFSSIDQCRFSFCMISYIYRKIFDLVEKSRKLDQVYKCDCIDEKVIWFLPQVQIWIGTIPSPPPNKITGHLPLCICIRDE